MRFYADPRGFTGAERALVLCFGLAIVALLGHLTTQGSSVAAEHARQALVSRGGGGARVQAAGPILPVAAPLAPGPAEGAAAPAQVILNVTWQGQERYYYCGPASTWMVLSARMASPPSQDALAGALGTTSEGTNHIGLVRDVLNSQLGTTWYEVKVMNNLPTQEQRDLLRHDVIYDLSRGYPIVANVVSGWRPPGYPGGDIYHYVAVVGYDQGGDRVLIADPAAECAGGSGWCNVPRTYWISMEELGTWIGGRGYAA